MRKQSFPQPKASLSQQVLAVSLVVYFYGLFGAPETVIAGFKTYLLVIWASYLGLAVGVLLAVLQIASRRKHLSQLKKEADASEREDDKA